MSRKQPTGPIVSFGGGGWELEYQCALSNLAIVLIRSNGDLRDMGVDRDQLMETLERADDLLLEDLYDTASRETNMLEALPCQKRRIATAMRQAEEALERHYASKMEAEE